MRQLYMQRKALLKENNCGPARGILPLLALMPVYITLFVSVRSFCSDAHLFPDLYESFRNGGIWWFPQLAERDPYFVLPATNFLLTLISAEVCAELRAWLLSSVEHS